MFLPTDNPKLIDPVIAIVIKTEQPRPEPKKHLVTEGDNLTKISNAFNVPVSRLWEANTQLTDPDQITPGMVLNVPENTDVLTPREMPSTITPLYNPVQTSAPSGRFSGTGLTGTRGYALPYGNCVDEPGVNSPNNGTNPISWAVLSYTPTIGATALWTYNHTGVVVGIWDNGDIEVRHQNYSYPQTRFPRSAFRGFR